MFLNSWYKRHGIKTRFFLCRIIPDSKSFYFILINNISGHFNNFKNNFRNRYDNFGACDERFWITSTNEMKHTRIHYFWWWYVQEYIQHNSKCRRPYLRIDCIALYIWIAANVYSPIIMYLVCVCIFEYFDILTTTKYIYFLFKRALCE